MEVLVRAACFCFLIMTRPSRKIIMNRRMVMVIKEVFLVLMKLLRESLKEGFD